MITVRGELLNYGGVCDHHGKNAVHIKKDSSGGINGIQYNSLAVPY